MGLSVLSVHAGQDTGGQGWRMTQGFRRHAPDWTFHSAVNPQTFTYIEYPQDTLWRDVKEAWAAADVVHLHNNFRTAKLFEGKRAEKPSVIHYHGTAFRSDPYGTLNEQVQRGVQGLVSTLDLWLIDQDHLEWLPAPYDLDWLASFRKPHAGDRIIVSHAPTNRDIKSTGELQRAIYHLQKDGYPVELDLIEYQTWIECLKRKGASDIYFDQVKLGYGCNAIEAWGMGVPVIAGGADPTLDEMERRFGSLPFYHATEETIYDALKELLDDPDLRQRMADRGRQHVEQFHDDAKVVAQLQRVYLRAAGIQEDVAA